MLHLVVRGFDVQQVQELLAKLSVAAELVIKVYKEAEG